MYPDLYATWTTLLGYPVSGIELIGTLSGLAAVYLAAKSNALTWPVGILNVICFFFIFYNVQLYSDMFLQIYYFAVSIYGWIVWNKKQEYGLQQSWLAPKYRMIIPFLILFSTLVLGYFISRLHLFLPEVFSQPADFPYTDTLIACMSIVATFLQARKKIDCWIIWIVTDILCTIVYWIKGIQLISLEYFVFTLLAVFGLISWIRIEKTHPSVK